MSVKVKRWFAAIAVAVALVGPGGCTTGAPMSGLWRTPSPYEQYLGRLRDARLDQTAMGRDWEAAGQRVLAQPLVADLPFRETAYFAPDTPAAIAYRMGLARGRRFIVDITFDSASPAVLFLPFPVSGLDGRRVQSLFGASRDAGVREHEGVDIFAPRGTAAIAVADGLARSSTNSLGGNVVWLHDAKMRLTYYYAHLDRWEREGQARVRTGDVLGYVGNTGNARTTSPHLHFGIYDRDAIDPLPCLAPDDEVPEPPAAPSERLGEWMRVVPPRTPLRGGSHRMASAVRDLDRGWLGRVVGVSRQSFRVTLPDNSGGYVASAAMAGTEQPLSRERLQSGDVVRELPAAEAPAVDIVTGSTQAEILGHFESFDLVTLPGRRGGWVQRSSTSEASRRPRQGDAR